MRVGAQPFLWKWVVFAWEWKILSISKVEHLTSFWYWGSGKLGNGLFIYFQLLTEHEFWDYLQLEWKYNELQIDRKSQLL